MTLDKLPKPSQSTLDKVQAVISTTILPIACLDPIKATPFVDPIEVNQHVYNRSTLEDMARAGGKDPFHPTAMLYFAAAKPAHYMLEAIIQHSQALDGKRPPLMDEHRDTQVESLKALFSEWDSLIEQAQQKEAGPTM